MESKYIKPRSRPDLKYIWGGGALEMQNNQLLTGLSEDYITTDEGIGLAGSVSCNPVSRSQRSLVAILLCSYDGAEFLSEQLDSIQAQTHENFIVYASDDGSHDDTHLILNQYRSRMGKAAVSIKSGPQTGFVANFLSQICDDRIKADYYAFADQDDIWEPNKLSIALGQLESVPGHVPAIYCSRTILIDSQGNEIGLSTSFPKEPSFANALIHNIAGGNTMVFNNAARDLLCQASKNPIVYHDWWAYILVTGVGGEVFYDDSHPSVKYRQHGLNLVGCKKKWFDRLIRSGYMLKGRYRDFNNTHIEALQSVRHLLTHENLKILDDFSSARNRWLIPRLLGLWNSGVYHQTFLGSIGLSVAAVLGKI